VLKDFFQIGGKIPVFKDKLNMWFIVLAKTKQHFFNKIGGRQSGPVLDFSLSDVRCSIISSSDIDIEFKLRSLPIILDNWSKLLGTLLLE